jgi:glutathione S-transferase
MRTGRPYLVGDKLSFADLMFVPWDNIRSMALLPPSDEETIKEKYPKYQAWSERLQGESLSLGSYHDTFC